jgi:O-acetyl-ADP-ribose deacetylase (regulator of RNase III)
MIKYVKGDLLKADVDVIAHGCNCRGGFGSGVAKQVATKFPKAKQYYLDKFEEDGWKLGDVQFVKVYGERLIANCATQDAYLPRGENHANYPAIEQVMVKLKNFCQAGNNTIAIPKIGAGLAGGDWSKIEEIINKVFDDYEILVYTLD